MEKQANRPMTIKDVAERTGLSVYTVRYYAREGLLPNVQRDKNGVRVFTEIDLETIYIIECLKNCDMTIREIKDYIQWNIEGDSTIDKRLALFQEKYNLIQEKIWRMQEIQDALRYKVWFYQTAKRAGTVEVHDRMKPEDIPLKMREIRARMKHAEGVVNGKELLSKIAKKEVTRGGMKHEKT